MRGTQTRCRKLSFPPTSSLCCVFIIYLDQIYASTRVSVALIMLLPTPTFGTRATHTAMNTSKLHTLITLACVCGAKFRVCAMFKGQERQDRRDVVVVVVALVSSFDRANIYTKLSIELEPASRLPNRTVEHETRVKTNSSGLYFFRNSHFDFYNLFN